MAARHILNGLGMTLLLALGASLVYVTVLLSSETLDDTSREKRSLLGDNEYLFKNSLHRIHWAKTISATAKSSNAKGELPNPQRFDKKSDLEYIFISVKTATKFHLERLQVILDTWFKLAPEQVSYYFYSMILLVLTRAQKSSGSGLPGSETSGSGSIGFTKNYNVRVRVLGFGFIGFVGFK